MKSCLVAGLAGEKFGGNGGESRSLFVFRSALRGGDWFIGATSLQAACLSLFDRKPSALWIAASDSGNAAATAELNGPIRCLSPADASIPA
jgi:hypothetical protein